MEPKLIIPSMTRRSSIKWWGAFVVVLLWLSGCSSFWVDPTLNSITVTDSRGITTPSVNLGTQEQMVAIGVFSDGSRSNIAAAWSSSSTSVATIDGTTGMLTTVAPGTTTITAANSGVTGTASVTVCGTGQAITVSPQNPNVTLGSGTLQFTAMANGLDVTNAVTWSSSSPGVATISNTSGTNGLATLVGRGSTTITATTCSFTNSTLLTVN